MKQTTITPTRTDALHKAHDSPTTITDVTLRVTLVKALHEGPHRSRKSKDGAAAYLAQQVLSDLAGLAPDAQVASYPDEKSGSLYSQDPDFPNDPMLPIFQSIMGSDVFVLVTTTSQYGYATPASIFSERFNDVLAQYGNRVDSRKVAGVVVVGGTGAQDLAACLIYMLNDIGFVIPPNACVVHDDGTHPRPERTVVNDQGIQKQMGLMVNSLVNLAKRLKGEEL